MQLVHQSGLNKLEIETALLKLESEGFVIRGRFTPGSTETEWSARRLLARIHSYTLNRLRQEIEPVSSADFIRFLLAWQKVAPDHQMEGPDSVSAIIDQLEGFEAPAAAWEGELLPSRLVEYDPAWLDALCLSGEVVWARLTPLVRSANDGNKTAARRRVRCATLPSRSCDARTSALEFGVSAATRNHATTSSQRPRKSSTTISHTRRFVFHRHRRKHRSAAQSG